MRIGGLVCSAWLLWVGYYVFVNGRGYDPARGTWVAVIVYALFFVTAFETFARELPKRFATHVIGAVVVGLLAIGYVVISLQNLGVMTDALALSLAAGKLVLQGHNPYGADLSWGWNAFGLPDSLRTSFVGGGHLTQINYPALAILLYVPAVALRLSPLVVSTVGLVGAVLLIVALAPPQLKTLAPIPFLVGSDSIKFVMGSLQDIWYVFLMLPAAFLWTEMPLAAGVFLGLACAVKQQPWLAVPFFFIGVARGVPGAHKEAVRRLAAAALGLLIGFGAPNAAFAASRPVVWLSAIVQPLTASFTPAGVGAVSLANSGALNLPGSILHWAPLIVLAVFSLAALRYFKELRNGLWLVPGLALFFSSRSLDNYFVYLLPVCVASWFGQLPHALEWKRRLIERWRAARARRLAAV